MRAPRFSIVVPTRDRADLLGAAIRSGLAQTHDDFEVLVSDNASTDGTAGVLAGFADSRVRVVRTPRPLLMHESWRFALAAARGRYVTFLCDDDALHPRTLELADRAITAAGADVVTWRSCSLGSDDWVDDWVDEGGVDEGWRGWLRFGPPYTDAALEISGRDLVDQAFALRVTFTELVPKVLNCAVDRSVLARAGAAGADPFRPSCPDYAAMLVLASYAERLVLLDAPLRVAGVTPGSVGASALVRGEAARRFEAELLAREPRLVLPVAVGPRITWLAQTFMQCAADVPDLRGRRVNEVHLHGLAGRELAAAVAAGADVGDLVATRAAALAGPLAPRAAAIEAFVRSGAEIESESFLRPRTDAAPVLGIGPFRGVDVLRRELGAVSIDAVAAALDPWLRNRAVRLGPVWDELVARAGPRSVVLYGLGRNGRALVRALTVCPHAVSDRLLGYDDAPIADPPAVGRLPAFARLDPRRHFVLVTPDASAAIEGTLAARGFTAGRDRVALARLDAMSTAGTARA